VTEPRVAIDRAGVEGVARAFAGAPRVAFDLESDGMFAYRAKTCAVQLAAGGAIAVVDALAAPLEPLAELLGARGPIKVVHDVAFDARMLAEAGLELGNVHDTAIAARMLGRAATGLASLAQSELGIAIDKELQHHDWRKRPFAPAELGYLARDVAHLEALDAVLWREVEARGIEAEVIEETRYRIRAAVAAAADAGGERAIAYGFAKGFDRLGPLERATFRRLWAAREAEAARQDVPAARLVATDHLMAIARRRPADARELASMRVPPRAEPMARAILEGVEAAAIDGDVPDDELARLAPPRPTREAILARRAREKALTAWRKAEAKARGVDEQVVLPGHCLKHLAESGSADEGTIRATPGFGACRARYVEPIAVALRGAISGGAAADADAPLGPDDGGAP
jgi:ribonuclease D